MNKRARMIYCTLMVAALSCGVTGWAAGTVWPEQQKQVGAAINAKWRPENATYLLSRDEADTLDLCRVLSRVERGAWLLGFACAVGAVVVSVMGRRRVW